MIEFPINKDKIPQEFLDKFKPSGNPEFIEDVFDKKVRDDICRFDKNYLVTLNTDVTRTFNGWLGDKKKVKKNVSVNIMGDTRSGKSLIALKMADNNTRQYKKPFDTEYIVCGNQREFRQKLAKAKFGDTFQIDENAFSNVGIGSNAESEQLKDIQNMIAKKNIHTIYITPKGFLQTGAKLGLEFHSTAVKDWLSKFMVFNLKANPLLMGYIIINVGNLFNDYGCFFNKFIGGCTNPNKRILTDITKDKLLFQNRQVEINYFNEELSRDFLKYSQCIPNNLNLTFEDVNKTLLNDDINDSPCPFYRICQSPMKFYEVKKDGWIKAQMEGGLNERVAERFRIIIELIKRAGQYSEEKDGFEMSVNKAKEIPTLVELYLPEITSTNLTITERKEILTSLSAMENKEVFFKMIKTLKLDLNETLKQIKNGENLKV